MLSTGLTVFLERTIFLVMKGAEDRDYSTEDIKIFNLTLLMEKVLFYDENIATPFTKLLFYILRKMDLYKGEVVIIPKEVAEELGISRGTLYKYLRVLMEKGYITKIGRFRYKLAPFYADFGRLLFTAKRFHLTHSTKNSPF